MRGRQVIAALAIVAAAAGCSGSGSSGSSSATATTTVAMRCRPATALLTSVLTSGLRPKSVALRKVTVVRGADRPDAYYVVADVTGPNVHAVGLWASTADTGSGPLFALNDVARRTSVWKDATKTAHPYALTDAGARFALGCS